FEGMFDRLVALGSARLGSEGVDEPARSFERSLDLRYAGQEFALPIPVDPSELRARDVATIRGRFDAAHEQRYGYSTPEEEVEMVNLRVVAKGARERPGLPAIASDGHDALVGRRPVWFSDPTSPVDCPVYARDRLASGAVVVGPAVVEEHSSTTLLWP